MPEKVLLEKQMLDKYEYLMLLAGSRLRFGWSGASVNAA
jgi:hypothetical protein